MLNSKNTGQLERIKGYIKALLRHYSGAIKALLGRYCGAINTRKPSLKLLY
jgi:hypothetical protein